jgi:hypothetical protein
LKIIFNDATELVVQSATIRGDGGLLIKTISDTEANLKNMFQDQTKTKKMTVTERESTLGEYENYTNMDAIVKYTAGITGVILYKVGETPAEKMEALASENAGLKKTVDMLQECILEMSELVYQ